MAQSEPAPLTRAMNVPAGHRGSASTTLAGRALLVAWTLSIAVHVLIFVPMLILAFPFSDYEKPDLPVTQTQIIGAVEQTSFVTSQAPVVPVPTELPDPEAARFTPREFVELPRVAVVKKPELSIIGIGAGGGDVAAYAMKVGGAAAPEFFGVGGSSRGARKIVYVVDRSGSMIDTFVYVQEELRRSISSLRRSQKFHVLFFNSGPPLEHAPRRLVSAIDAQKEKFFEFLDRVIPHGRTRPGIALRRALALEPDLIYLLSDGDDFPPSLLKELDGWNGDRRTKIHTIAYLNPTGRAVLERIAREHHGEFRFVSEDDLP